MLFPRILLAVAGLFATAVVVSGCRHDKCYRAVRRYERKTDSDFCISYLVLRTLPTPTQVATCGDLKLSSVCSCRHDLTRVVEVVTKTLTVTQEISNSATATTVSTITTATPVSTITTATPVSTITTATPVSTITTVDTPILTITTIETPVSTIETLISQ